MNTPPSKTILKQALKAHTQYIKKLTLFYDIFEKLRPFKKCELSGDWHDTGYCEELKNKIREVYHPAPLTYKKLQAFLKILLKKQATMKALWSRFYGQVGFHESEAEDIREDLNGCIEGIVYILDEWFH